jgi:hypothetical protein
MLFRSCEPAGLTLALFIAMSEVTSQGANISSRKYELLTSDTKIEDGHKLIRVRRISDGVLGGYIESEKNLSQAGTSFLDDQSRAYGQARIEDDAQLHGLARDSAQLSGRASVYGAIYGRAKVKDNAVVYGQAYDDSTIEGSAVIHGQVFGSATVAGRAQVYGRVFGKANVGDDETIYGDRE